MGSPLVGLLCGVVLTAGSVLRAAAEVFLRVGVAQLGPATDVGAELVLVALLDGLMKLLLLLLLLLLGWVCAGCVTLEAAVANVGLADVGLDELFLTVALVELPGRRAAEAILLVVMEAAEELAGNAVGARLSSIVLCCGEGRSGSGLVLELPAAEPSLCELTHVRVACCTGPNASVAGGAARTVPFNGSGAIGSCRLMLALSAGAPDTSVGVAPLTAAATCPLCSPAGATAPLPLT
jgi:hypothetical protein